MSAEALLVLYPAILYYPILYCITHRVHCFIRAASYALLLPYFVPLYLFPESKLAGFSIDLFPSLPLIHLHFCSSINPSKHRSSYLQSPSDTSQSLHSEGQSLKNPAYAAYSGRCASTEPVRLRIRLLII